MHTANFIWNHCSELCESFVTFPAHTSLPTSQLGIMEVGQQNPVRQREAPGEASLKTGQLDHNNCSYPALLTKSAIPPHPGHCSCITATELRGMPLEGV